MVQRLVVGGRGVEWYISRRVVEYGWLARKFGMWGNGLGECVVGKNVFKEYGVARNKNMFIVKIK